MKKYLEQRVEELELEVKLLRAKIKLNEPNGTSKYINNYSKYAKKPIRRHPATSLGPLLGIPRDS